MSTPAETREKAMAKATITFEDRPGEMVAMKLNFEPELLTDGEATPAQVAAMNAYEAAIGDWTPDEDAT